ncbi:MAG TPA: gliding motility-associated ABC transporter ATP-binding subunit GldA, partial [Cyclobacteriaceae bacterium]|nr:gliding motility-associated ABC transporter ATP-binding subunit GldA [Cyclobacteriaceae bacterium]
KETSRNKTVIFSTHIMQEVQALCDRVVVINKGTIVADDRLENLMSRQPESRSVVVEFERDVPEEDLRQISGVASIEKIDAHRYKIISSSGIDLRPEIFRFAADKNLSLVGLKQEESSLENIFRELTSPAE